jgi:inhibitor of cysteine peptidase
MAELNVGFEDKNKTIPAKVGDTIIITLQENATTGYQWNMTSFSSDTLALVSKETTSASSTVPGAGGSEVVFRLKPTASGLGRVNVKVLRGGEIDIDSAFGVEFNFDIS